MEAGMRSQKEGWVGVDLESNGEEGRQERKELGERNREKMEHGKSCNCYL